VNIDSANVPSIHQLTRIKTDRWD